MIQENPNFFKPQKPLEFKEAWSNWDAALEWLAVLGGIIALLVLYKLIRKLF